MSENKNLQIKNTTKGKLPRLPFVDIKDSVLGKKYSLSLIHPEFWGSIQGKGRHQM